MIDENVKLMEILNEFCKNNNVDIKNFEVARIGNGLGSGDRKILSGPSTVKNKDCTYVIKLFVKYNLIVIWNYKNNHNMSYSYETIKEKLEKGIFLADKGKDKHTRDQSVIFFSNSENFETLLNKIIGKI